MNDRINFNHYNIDNLTKKSYKIEEHSTEDFAEALDRIIKASGITHQILGKALKVSNTTIHNYIHGYRRNPTKDFMVDISDYFDIKPSYFKEYRIMLLEDRFKVYPELVDIFIDLAQNPQNIKSILIGYNEKNEYENMIVRKIKGYSNGK